jgi:hypothetical protein
VSPVKYELGSYIPEDGILHSDGRENLKSHIYLSVCHVPVLSISLPFVPTSLFLNL